VPRTLAQAVGFLLGLWIALALSPLLVRTARGAEPADFAPLEAELHDAVNRVRADRHLIALARRDDLDRVAFEHSADMARRGYFSHLSPEGANPVDRLVHHGVGDMRLAAENLGKTTHASPTAQIVENWLQSPDHRTNLIAPAFNFTGIGVAQAADGSLIYTQIYVLVPR
jgi:uncharacterized protein YkwD